MNRSDTWGDDPADGGRTLRLFILGAGRLGGVLGMRWAAQGHDVTWIVPADSVARRAELATRRNARVTSAADAGSAMDALVVTTPWAVAVDAVAGLAIPPGTPLLDCTNPVGFGPGGVRREVLEDGSVAARLAARFPELAVVKTLNQVGADVVEDPRRYPTAPLMFVAGDDDDVREHVATLVRALGFDVRHAGGLANAAALEALALLWMHDAMQSAAGRHQSFAVQTPATTVPH